MAKYTQGQMVRLKSDPSIEGAVINVLEGSAEIRYQVFTGDVDVAPSLAPVRWKGLQDPFRAFGDHKKGAVRAAAHHVPSFRAPFVRGIDKEVGSKAGVDRGSAGDAVHAFVLS